MDCRVLLLAVTLSALLSIGYCVQCYECNVWKAGYGHLCAEPRIRTDCMFCMKLDTEVWTGYYKDTPRYANTTTRICANDITPHFSNECHRYTTVDGSSTRCYCDTDLCNTGATLGPPGGLISVTLLTAVVSMFAAQGH